MKKIGFLLVLAVLLAAFTGCTAMSFVSDAGAFPADASTYEVLGRVTTQTSSTKSGYSKLYATAKSQYPTADDVVNVKIDRKDTWFLIFHFASFEMSGIAIHYK